MFVFAFAILKDTMCVRVLCVSLFGCYIHLSGHTVSLRGIYTITQTWNQSLARNKEHHLDSRGWESGVLTAGHETMCERTPTTCWVHCGTIKMFLFFLWHTPPPEGLNSFYMLHLQLSSSLPSDYLFAEKCSCASGKNISVLLEAAFLLRPLSI